METILILAVVAIVLALIFDFTNGFHDASNLVATMLASRAMPPPRAVILASTFEFLGPILGGTAVANTVGKILNEDGTGILVPVVLAAIIAAIAWNLFTWYFGIPSSSSHALIGGLVGAALVATRSTTSVHWGFHGFDPLHPSGVFGVAMALMISPFLGFIAGFVLQKITAFALRGATPRANTGLKRLQWVTASILAFSHGTNDAQKTMGIITLLLVSGGWITTFEVPLWVKGSAALMIALGALSGGWRIMRTIGRGIFKVRPIHGFSSQAASAAVILGNALTGGPVSTTHVVSSTVMGVGTASKVRAVKWGRVGDIVLTWLITIPASMLLAALVFLAIRLVLGDAGVHHE